ncbi:hypothetical protein GNE00_03520 [Pseudomonas sp. JL972]|uniref:hypothetical protein n=1 Tax=Stutzerimonas degradans TaxID=2968968 RepID=UPI0012D8E3C4|nr:hypothetical protein [Stutzerimonas degradans]MTZ12797.1 hypothetical protein [Stutzerimonas degradans]
MSSSTRNSRDEIDGLNQKEWLLVRRFRRMTAQQQADLLRVAEAFAAVAEQPE